MHLNQHQLTCLKVFGSFQYSIAQLAQKKTCPETGCRVHPPSWTDGGRKEMAGLELAYEAVHRTCLLKQMEGKCWCLLVLCVCLGCCSMDQDNPRHIYLFTVHSTRKVSRLRASSTWSTITEGGIDNGTDFVGLQFVFTTSRWSKYSNARAHYCMVPCRFWLNIFPVPGWSKLRCIIRSYINLFDSDVYRFESQKWSHPRSIICHDFAIVQA